MELLHTLLTQPPLNLSQVTFIGSDIAEEKADVNASSYSVGKHGLLGLFRTISQEKNSLDLRLYSPGYMDTDLLPPNAEPRQHAGLVHNPEIVAKDLLEWIMNPSPTFHRRFS